MLMMFSMISRAETGTGAKLQHIERTEEGYLFNENQIIELANYISELEAENERLRAERDQAVEEIEKAYEEDTVDFRQFENYLTGAGLAALIILIAE